MIPYLEPIAEYFCCPIGRSGKLLAMLTAMLDKTRYLQRNDDVQQGEKWLGIKPVPTLPPADFVYN